MSGDLSATSPVPRGTWLDGVSWLLVPTGAALADWLTRHAEAKEGVWVVTYKKRPGLPYVSRWELLDELLCHGWIDGARKVVNQDLTAQWVSPRRHDRWTQTYRQRVERLLKAGRVQPPGQQAIARAKRSGTWEFGQDIDALVEPDDLVAELKGNAKGRTWWSAQAPSYRRNLLRWLNLAATPRTRQARLKTIADSSNAGQRLRHL